MHFFEAAHLGRVRLELLAQLGRPCQELCRGAVNLPFHVELVALDLESVCS